MTKEKRMVIVSAPDATDEQLDGLMSQVGGWEEYQDKVIVVGCVFHLWGV